MKREKMMLRVNVSEIKCNDILTGSVTNRLCKIFSVWSVEQQFTSKNVSELWIKVQCFQSFTQISEVNVLYGCINHQNQAVTLYRVWVR